MFLSMYTYFFICVMCIVYLHVESIAVFSRYWVSETTGVWKLADILGPLCVLYWETSKK